jgi:hypothetical protein
MNGVGTNNPSGNGPMRAIVTPTSDMQVGIKFISFYGTLNAPGLIGSANNATGGAPNQCYFIAKQIGSSAIVNPWVLSGNDVYNTTGKVGIGTSSPAVSAILDLTSSTQGLLPPRLALTAKSGASTPIASPTTGLVVYNSATAGSTSDAVSPGFYYFNGTVWVRMDPDGWSSNTAISFSAPSGYTAPTKGASPIVDYVKYRNIGGKDYEVEYNLVQSTAGTGGNGDYLISLPAGLQFDNTYPGQAFYTGAAGFAAMKNKLASAIGDLIVANFHNSATVIPYNATQFRIQTNNWGNSTNTWLFMGYNNYSLVDANTTMKMVFRFRAL